MSTDGTFINDVWVSGRPWWPRRRKLSGRTKPYPKWTGAVPYEVVFALSILSFFVPAEFSAWLRADYLRLATLLAVIATVLAVYTWWRNAPQSRQKYRLALIEKGELLTPDDSAGKMVLTEHIRTCWNRNLSSRPTINKALKEFADLMARGTRQFGSSQWYLVKQPKQQILLRRMLSFDSTHPLGQIAEICNCQHELKLHIINMLDREANEHKRKYVHDEVRVSREIDDYEDFLERAHRELWDIREQIEYKPSSVIAM